MDALDDPISGEILSAADDGIGECRLCGAPSMLRVSHIVPAFAFKWLKETSGTGFIRHSREPNKRVQDGFKLSWLCAGCEERFNEFETPFATKLFHPLTKEDGARVPYGDWLLKFCVSISWRVLTFSKEGGHLDGFTHEDRRLVQEALDTWAGFLLGRLPHPGRFEQHFLPFSGVTEYSGSGLPVNINRYLMRAVEIDLGSGNGYLFVFTKIGPMMVMGMIRMRSPQEWQGTKVRVRGGVIQPGAYYYCVMKFEGGVGLVVRSRRGARDGSPGRCAVEREAFCGLCRALGASSWSC
jgi:hypothetical protein